jgi:hypothetical protein
MSGVKPSTASATEPHPWRGSEAQKVLHLLLVSGDLPAEQDAMTPLAIWNTFCLPRREFSGFLYKKFPPRLRAMQKQHRTKVGRADDELNALVNDRLHFPVPSHNHRGEPRWNGSEAERLLKVDVAAKNHERMTPMQLHGTRTEYGDYPLEVFRKHIHQEVRRLKLNFQYGTKNKCS